MEAESHFQPPIVFSVLPTGYLIIGSQVWMWEPFQQSTEE